MDTPNVKADGNAGCVTISRLGHEESSKTEGGGGGCTHLLMTIVDIRDPQSTPQKARGVIFSGGLTKV